MSGYAYDGTNAIARDSGTGEIDTAGDGQVNFSIEPPEGYKVAYVKAAEDSNGKYKNLKDLKDVGVDNAWRLTKVTGDVTIQIGVVEDTGEPAVTITGKEAPKTGDVLNVKTSGLPAGFELRWYVDGAEAASGEDFALSEGHYGKIVSVQAELSGEVLAQDSLFFSDIPVVYIDTDDGQGISSKTEYKHAAMRVQGDADWAAQYDGGAQIRGRGNSTWNLPKKPYKIKLDSGTDLFGMGKNKHWVLLANFLDPSLVRNTVAQGIGGAAGLVTMDSVWVDVVVNGEPVGNYQLSEQIRVGKTRVDIFDWEDLAEDLADAFYDAHKASGMTKEQGSALEDQLTANLSWISSDVFSWDGIDYKASDYVELPDDISGGYLFELSWEYDEPTRFMTPSQYRVMAKKPEMLYTNSEMLEFSKGLWNSWDAAIHSEDGYAEGVWLGDIADIGSLASYWLCMEVMGNSDAVYKSRYAYIDQGGKLTFGPLWDFDWGCAAPIIGWTSGEGWKIVRSGNSQNFYRELLDDPYFVMVSAARYWQLRPYLLSLVEDNGVLDSYVGKLANSGEANDALWGASLESVLKARVLQGRTFQEDNAVFKAFLTERIAWLDAQFADLDTAMTSLRVDQSANPYVKSDAVSLHVQGSWPGVSGAAGVGSAESVVAANDVRVDVEAVGVGAEMADVYVNGRKGPSVKLAEGTATAALSKALFGEQEGRPDLVSVILRDGDGATVAKTYTLLSAHILYSAEEVEAAIADAVSNAMDGLSSKEEVEAAIAEAVSQVTADLYTKEQVDEAIEAAVAEATRDMMTKSQQDAAIAAAVSDATNGLSSREEVEAAISEATSGLYTKTEVDAVVDAAVSKAVEGLVTPAQQEEAIKRAASDAARTVQEASDRRAADAVISHIAAIGEVNEGSGQAIAAARVLYDGLTDAQKELVSADSVSMLEAAEAAYAALSAPAATAQPELSDASATRAKLPNTMSVAAKHVTVKAKSLQRKAVVVKKAKAFKVRSARGKVTFKVTRYLTGKARKKVKVASSGKLGIKRGLPTGTYWVMVKVSAAGNSVYAPASKRVALSIRVA